MSREATLRRHVRSLEMLDEAVMAMKSLSAHHFRVARDALSSARAYREALNRAVAAVPAPDLAGAAGPPLLVVIGADLGLCAQYHARLVEAACAHARALTTPAVDCVGRRTASLLTRAGVAPRKVYGAPTSVENATRVLLEIVEDLFGAYRERRAGSVHIVSARFGGIGTFEAAPIRLLPLEPLEGGGAPPSRYVSRAHLQDAAVRERIFTELQLLLLDAMASEHGMRLMATETAGQWLEQELVQARRKVAALRRETATQEILELMSGTRRRVATSPPDRFAGTETRCSGPDFHDKSG